MDNSQGKFKPIEEIPSEEVSKFFSDQRYLQEQIYMLLGVPKEHDNTVNKNEFLNKRIWIKITSRQILKKPSNELIFMWQIFRNLLMKMKRRH